MPYSQGQAVEYHSERLNKWIETKVVEAEGAQVKTELKKDDFVSVDKIRYPSGANIQFELNGRWVDANVLHTEEDGRVQIGLWYNPAEQAEKFRQAEEVQDDLPDIPVATVADARMAALAAEVAGTDDEGGYSTKFDDGLSPGDAVKYYSRRKKQWFETTVTDGPRADGSVQVALKPGVWVRSEEVKKVDSGPAHSTVVHNQAVPGVPETHHSDPTHKGTVHALVCAPIYDWNRQWGPHDFRDGLSAFQGLLRKSGITNVTELVGRHSHRDKVLGGIKQVGSNCSEGDTFLFYYTGHGDSMPDQDGDEEDGMDEALCTPDRAGNINQGTYLRDDTFAEFLHSYVKATHIIVIIDACHSGTICDMNKRFWHGKSAASITGCRDNQISHGTGRGGLMTLSMCKAADALRSKAGQCSVARFFNQLRNDAHAMKGTIAMQATQTLTLESPPGCDTQQIPWPLLPR